MRPALNIFPSLTNKWEYIWKTISISVTTSEAFESTFITISKDVFFELILEPVWLIEAELVYN